MPSAPSIIRTLIDAANLVPPDQDFQDLSVRWLEFRGSVQGTSAVTAAGRQNGGRRTLKGTPKYRLIVREGARGRNSVSRELARDGLENWLCDVVLMIATHGSFHVTVSQRVELKLRRALLF